MSSRLLVTQTLVRKVFVSLAAALVVSAAASAQPSAGSFAEIAKRIGPAVVSIDAKSRVQPPAARGAEPGAGNEDLMDFLRRQMQQRPVTAVGSGFIVDGTGHIITNAHVVNNAARIIVRLNSGEEFNAVVVGEDDETDIAVLKIDARRELPFVRFGDSDKVEVGDWVLAIGSPFGLSKSVTAGIISQTRRETPYASAFQRFIQTDAAINRGNSGGPLVNMNGEVIGVNSQIATSTGDYNGVGFALPSREAEYVLGQILKNGKVRRGYLGVLLDSVKAEFAAVYGLREAKGAIVTDVRDDRGPAAAAGLKAGDIITDVNGNRIEGSQDLIARIASTPPDQAITVSYLRENGTTLESRTATIKLAERPSRVAASGENDRRPLSTDPGRPEQKPFGLTLVEMTPTIAATYRLEGQKGLLVKEINPSSFIADLKNSTGGDALGEGDLIQRINRVSVTDLKAFDDVARKLKTGDPVVLHVVSYNPRTRAPELKIVQFTVR